jgi:hypothetical protein
VKRAITALRLALVNDGPIVAGLGAVWIALLILLASKGVNGLQPESYAANLILYAFTLFVMGVFVFMGLLYRARPESPISYLFELVASGEWLVKLARGLPMLAALVVMMPAFSAMKSSIGLFDTYHWDSTWINADQAIHGADAWRLLQPVLGFPIVTSGLSVA